MKHFRVKGFLWAVLLCLSFSSFAGPVSMLQGVSKRMLAQLEQRQGRLTYAMITNIVNRTIVPVMDVRRMSGMVVGREYWRGATSSQRSNFITQFKRLVINTYADALKSYNDDRVKFYPLRGGASGSVVRVKSLLIRKNGQEIPMNYNLIKRGGHWKVYDFSIEGVSLVRNYRSQFSSTLRKGGMPQLIARLKTYNKRAR